MSKHSVEEVRAHARMLRECRINTEATRDRQQDKLADICDAYADLLERIAADEGAVPVAQLRLRLDRWDVVGIHGAIEKLHLPAGEYPLFVRPPAQAAQVVTQSMVHEAMAHVPFGLSFPARCEWIANYLNAAGAEPNKACECCGVTPAGDIPGDEPVAQGEDWRIGMFDRWRAAAQEKGYAGIAEAITAAPSLSPGESS